MVDLFGWATLLSFGQAWLPICVLSGIICCLRARNQGHTKGVYCSLGLLLGPGALPVVWIATHENLTSPTGLGLNATVSKPVPSAALVAWKKLYLSCQELQLGLLLGVGVGLFLNFTQAMTYFLPQFFFPDHLHTHPSRPMVGEDSIRIAWILVALLSPTLVYLAANRWMRSRLLDRILFLYAYQSAGERWRELVPSNLKRPADSDFEDPNKLHQQFEERIRQCSPRTVMLALILLFVMVMAFFTLGAVAYQDCL